MSKIQLLNVAKDVAVKAKPFAVPLLGALVTTVGKVIAEQKAEARIINMENRIKDLESLLKK